MQIPVLWLASALPLMFLVLYSLLRVRSPWLLKHLQATDIRLRREVFVFPRSLSVNYEKLITYQPCERGFRLERLSTLEFILHDYARSQVSFFHPYYTLMLDESRRGSQITVRRHLRLEVLMVGLVAAVVLTAWLGVGPGSALLVTMGMLGFIVLASERLVRPPLEQLLRFMGAQATEGGEHEQWATF